ncbi:MAG: hypothetical protein Ct9H90mP24_6190 [Methanobacteriota archaeon]|nr:MAG: hypothetical protein Ct9H90mP24_6190 [Euryarchaeota archaeon]
MTLTTPTDTDGDSQCDPNDLDDEGILGAMPRKGGAELTPLIVNPYQTI